MHDGHDHHDHHHHPHPHPHPHPMAGHNHAAAPQKVVQWQAPHRENGDDSPDSHEAGEPDLDLVEAAFVEGFVAASDPTSFLRLAQVPFTAGAADGAVLSLLRVEVDCVADVGALTPHMGGASFHYDPLPARMISRRKRLRLVYFDGQRLRTLALSEARGLEAA